MPPKGKLDLVTSLLQQQLIVAPPRVDEVQIEVRTGCMVVPDALMAHGAPELFGEFVVEWGFDIADAVYPSFQENLLAAEQVLGSTAAGADPETMPRGVKYLGTYFVMSGAASGAGRYRTLWGFYDYAAYQAFRDKSNDGASQFAQALCRLTLDHDRSAQATFSTAIFQRAVGLRRLWDIHPISGGDGTGGEVTRKRSRAPVSRKGRARQPPVGTPRPPGGVGD